MPRDFTHTNNWEIGLQVQFAFFPRLPNAGPSNLIRITLRFFSHAPLKYGLSIPQRSTRFLAYRRRLLQRQGLQHTALEALAFARRFSRADLQPRLGLATTLHQ